MFAEMDGPGCIWRIWSAAPGEGHVRIYLDGASEPAVDLPFKGYFDCQNAPFNRTNLVHTLAMGCNNYVPIPYQKSCKVVADEGWGSYFHFNYTTFAKDTQVPTFHRDLSQADAAVLDHANEALLQAGQDLALRRLGGLTTKVAATVDAGSRVDLFDLKGPLAITVLRLKVELPPPPADRNPLRELAIQIRWDDEENPSVWAPLGDFFGTAPGANVYRSMPLGLTRGGWWYSYWFMPFRKNAVVTLINDGAEPRQISAEITTARLAQPSRRYARFHAKWHRDAFLPTEPERRIDWTLLKTEGAGRFCGVMLHVWNPKGGWWGEGDEKFFVDGEKFPSTIGTGSEDYFGYAWGKPTLFQNAYHSQTMAMENKGHISVNRWHISDQVPFQKSFEGSIEKYPRNTRPTLYASTAYWYLSADGKDPYLPRPLSERIGYWSETVPFAVPGALEGERLKTLGRTGGTPREQTLAEFDGLWSQDSHLLWAEAKPGDKLDLALPIPKSGRFNMTCQLTKAPDYGIVQLYLDGRKLGDPIDLYHPSVAPSGPLDLGAQELEGGDHKLTVEMIGANAAAIKSYLFGLDYVRILPSE